jgi:hypothetical protein
LSAAAATASTAASAAGYLPGWNDGTRGNDLSASAASSASAAAAEARWRTRMIFKGPARERRPAFVY